MDADLSQLLGAPPPPGVAALPAADQAELAAIIDAARQQQSLDLAASFEITLRYIPFPFRRLVMKMLMG